MKMNPIKYQEAPKVLTVFFTHSPTFVVVAGFFASAGVWGGGASLDDSVAEGHDHHDKLVLRSKFKCHMYIYIHIYTHTLYID